MQGRDHVQGAVKKGKVTSWLNPRHNRLSIGIVWLLNSLDCCMSDLLRWRSPVRGWYRCRSHWSSISTASIPLIRPSQTPVLNGFYPFVYSPKTPLSSFFARRVNQSVPRLDRLFHISLQNPMSANKVSILMHSLTNRNQANLLHN